MTWKTLFPALLLVSAMAMAQTQPRTIEIMAAKDSHFKIDGQSDPTLVLKAGEEVRLVITAVKAKTQDRNGSVHGLTLLRVKDDELVSDWDFALKPGKQEFVVKAPAEAGEYHAVCSVICSKKHEKMQMKVIVQD
jgi:heme/copper-type cytochrome/quinol oxidase subunit 2